MWKKMFFCLFVLIVGCTPQIEPQNDFQEPQSELDKLLNEEINYSTYSDNGFSVLYPQWPEMTNGDVEMTVSKGYCTVAINFEKLPAKQWYDMMVTSLAEQGGIVLAKENFQIKYSLDYKNNKLISDNRIFECNEDSIAITISCIEEVEEIMQKLSNRIFPSVNCEEEEIIFKKYSDDDFSVEYPAWEGTIDGGNERLLGVSKGVCSIIVDRHNALPDDIIDWLNKAIEEKENHTLLTSNEYSIVYQFPYEDDTLTATTKIIYCNYQSYITQFICVDEYVSESDIELKNSVLESSKCAKVYEIPTPEKIEEEKEEIKEKEPEVIEEIEDQIVKTNAGEEFGIDEEMVVYFINNNEFFTIILKDFSKANLLIEDKDAGRELKLRAVIDNGKIQLLEDGHYSNADVTLIVPLRDALNIFNNAANINPLTLLGFAMNVRTEPVNIKNEVIQKVLRGDYN